MNGKVYLVGAGPGDPELLTLKAVRLLQRADAVLHDDLVSPEILKLVAPSALRYDVGKRCGRKATRQEEIHFLMIELACQGLQVVRLKGGDPTIFARAGEEIRALQNAGIEFEVVPGVTSALAAAAVAGISLTMRDTASSLLIMTGHFSDGAKNGGSKNDESTNSFLDEKRPLPDLRALIASGTTIALYMPGNEPSRTVHRLVSAGLTPDTPCALISRASTRAQQVTVTTLDALGQSPRHAKPAILIVGDVVALAQSGRVRLEHLGAQAFILQSEPFRAKTAPATVAGPRFPERPVRGKWVNHG